MTETATPTSALVVEEQETRPGFIGTSVPRKEDRRLVQGEGVFFDDVKRHGMGFVHFVRSPYAHAKIKSIDVARALELKDEVVLHEDAGSNTVWSGVFDWGDFDAALADADHVVRIERLHFDRFSSTPLECSGVLVEYNRGTGQWTMYCNHQMPGIGAIWMAPALRVGTDKLRFVT